VGALVALYDAEVRFNDESFGSLLAELDRLGVGAKTAIVFTADHGEEFGDHGGFEHGHTLFAEMLHVPLIVRQAAGPGRGARSHRLARQVDIAPPILAIAGVAPGSLPGSSLVEGGAAQPSTPDDPDEPIESFSQTSLGPELASITTRSW